MPKDIALVVSADLINLYYIKIVFNKAVNMSKEDFVNKNISTFAGIYMSSCVSRRIPENSAFKDDEFVHNNIIENNIAEGNESVAWLCTKST